MFQPNYPSEIKSECQLNIFMDYVIHGIMDDVSYPIEFHGVKTEEDYFTKTVKVIIPIKLLCQHLSEFEKDFESRVAEIVKELKYHCYFAINLEVHFEISFLNKLGLEVHKLSEEKEENNMHIPEVEKIIHKKSNRGEFFTVCWKDETKTTVKLAEGDNSDDYTAFLYALGKKLFKDKGKARELIKAKKKVFEDELEQKQREYYRHRRNLAIQQSYDAREDFEDIEGVVYGEMFVAPTLVSRSVFKRNKGDK